MNKTCKDFNINECLWCYMQSNCSIITYYKEIKLMSLKEFAYFINKPRGRYLTTSFISQYFFVALDQLPEYKKVFQKISVLI